MGYNFPEYFRVDINQDDIDNSTMSSITGCAIAVAFKRECPGQLDPSCVLVESGTVGFCEYDFFDAEKDQSTLQNFTFDMCDDLQLHARAFDLDKTRVKPVNVHFNVTKIEYEEAYNELHIYGDASIDEDISDLIKPRYKTEQRIEEIDGMVG